MDRAPPRAEWTYALRTIRAYDAAAYRPVASTYDETQTALDITHPDGIRRPTVFFSSTPGRDRLVRLGWEDVTDLWPAADDSPAPKRRVPVPLRGV